MTVVGTNELVLAALLHTETGPDDDTSAPGRAARSIAELSGLVGVGDSRLRARVELAATIKRLRNEGLLERHHDDRASETVLTLTEAGTQRAKAVHETLVETSIELVTDDERETLSVAEAAERLCESPVAIAAGCTDDGVYYRERQLPSDRFVDREPERDRWEAVLEQANREGSGAAVFCIGPPGIGKTALADHFLERAREAGADVYSVQCQAAGNEPFAPVRDALDQLSAEPNPFAETTLDVSTNEAYEAQQAVLFRDVTEVLTPDETERVHVLSVDALDQADAGTIAYLEFLAERLADRRLILLGTCRSESGPEEFTAVENAAPVTRFELDPFDRSETRQLVESVVGRRGAPSAFVDAVHEVTGGNPLFIELTVETLLETDQVDPNFNWYPEGSDAIDTPGRVHEAIAERIERLEPDARELLRRAAVIGETVPLWVLEAVCTVDGDRLGTIVDVLVGAGVFTRERDSTVSFRSTATREAIGNALEESERSEIHGTIARAFDEGTPTAGSTNESTSGEVVERMATTAYHYDAAGEIDTAIQRYLGAVDRGTDLYAHETAIETCYRALTLARETDDRDDLLETGERLADLYRTTGSYDDADRYVQFVRERTPDSQLSRHQRLARVAATIAAARGDYDRAISEAEKGLELDETPTAERCRLLVVKASAESSQKALEAASETVEEQYQLARRIEEPTLEGRGLRLRGEIAVQQGDYERADEYARQALDRFETIDDRHRVGDAQYWLGEISWMLGELADSHDHAKRALDAYDAVGVPQGRANAHFLLGKLDIESGEFEEARTHFQQALTVDRDIGNRHGVAFDRHHLGLCACGQGAYADAREHFRQAAELHESVGDDASAASARHWLGWTDVRRGNYDRARERCQSALEQFEDYEDSYNVGFAHTFLGVIARRQGAYDRAETHLEEATALFEAAGGDHDTIRTHRELGALARRRGEFERAREHLETALETAVETGVHWHTGGCHSQLAALARATGEFDRAAEHLQDARTRFETQGNQYGLSIVRVRQGRLARDRGAYETAQDHIESALQSFESLGATHWAATARFDLGTVAKERTDIAVARALWNCALETFVAIEAVGDALETLEHLVELSDQKGSETLIAEYCERAIDLLEDQTVGAFNEQREWFAERAQQSNAADRIDR